MANYFWQGLVSTSANVASNWVDASLTPYGGIPSAGDVVIYDDKATQNCNWDIATPVSPNLTVDEMILEDNFIHNVILDTTLRVKGMFLNATIASSGIANAVEFYHGASPNFFGSYKTYNERFVLIGDNGVASANTFEMYGSATPVTKFDDGYHPVVSLNTGRFAPDYVTPTGTSGKTTFQSIAMLTPTDFSPDGSLVDNDRLKVFSFEALGTITVSSINFGLSTVEYYATPSGFDLPTYGSSGVPSDFQAYYRKIVVKANGAGHKCTMSDNTFISVEEFEIDDGAVVKGPTSLTSQGAEIRSMKSPKIRGTWSFSQVSQGVYRSPRHAAGPIDLVNGDVHITGKLTVDGLIDPTGLELTPVAANPGGVAANTLWLDSTNSNKLTLGSTEVGGGGGGSGTVTSVDMAVPTGFTISGNPITGTGTLALAFDTGYALPTSAKQTQWDTAYGWGDHSTQGYLTSTPPETDPIFVASEAALLSAGDAAKLAGIQAGAQVNVPLQHMRLYGINTGSNLHTVTSGSRVYLDLGDTAKFAESTTGSHPDITVTNAATDYITIAAGGIYQITGHVGIFPASFPATHDVWVEYNTNTSANRELGVSRMQHASNSTGNMNYKHSTVVEVPSTGSDMDIYISVFSNGATANVRAYDNNRFFFTITRIGDSTV